MKMIALYGGSFNPSTAAHLAVGLQLLDELPIDEVWYMVSPQNPFKSINGMANFNHRVAMARLNLEGHPRLVVKDYEAAYAKEKPNGIIETADSLSCLTRDFPEHRFIWVLGADNFVKFHQWGNADYISRHYPIALVPRMGYNDAALESVSATTLPRLENPFDIHSHNGWYKLSGEGSDGNATYCRNALQSGDHPQGLRPPVIDYATQNRVYALH